jgi:hypothetical protein
MGYLSEYYTESGSETILTNLMISKKTVLRVSVLREVHTSELRMYENIMVS